MLKSTQKLLILHNIRSVHNTGALFRTADALGIDMIYLIGETATPFDRFGRARSDFAKTALGSELTMPWKYYKTIAPVLTKLKKEGYTSCAIKQTPVSMD